jgi:hypothetical protein
VRSAVLSGGFGLGIAVMASLLGIGDVILEQARSPELAGGGDLLIAGAAGRVGSARFLTSSVMTAPPLAGRAVVASPTSRERLYLVRKDRTLAIRARGGIPSLERALGDAETAAIDVWQDRPTDRAWVAPDPGELLRGMDRFHPIPRVPERADSWAELLYFNGETWSTRFYLSFITGRLTEEGRREAVVRLQLERNGEVTNYSDYEEIDPDELLAHAPDLRIGGGSVRLEGLRYRLRLDLPEELDGGRSHAKEPLRRVRGEIALLATPGRSMVPLTIRGARGWISGYVVPVLSGPLEGELIVGAERIAVDGGTGYHDHNWGFWEGVSWQWGQVAGEGLSFVFGRVHPPPEAADPDRMPGFMAVLGPDGPIGYSMDVTIRERNEPDGRPNGISVRSRGGTVDLTMELNVDDLVVSRVEGLMAVGRELDFLQMRATYRVSGRVGDRSIDFTAAGSAETFRGR